jgi:hypothetical protein
MTDLEKAKEAYHPKIYSVEYTRETGRLHKYYDDEHSSTPTWEYVNWLEKKLSDAENKISGLEDDDYENAKQQHYQDQKDWDLK